MALLSWEQAHAQVGHLALTRRSVWHAVDAGLMGRTLAAPVVAEVANPRFVMSAMDGWAIHPHDSTAGAQGVRVGATVLAGMQAPELEPGTACAVMTGAPVPAGTGSVIPVEEVRVQEGYLYWDAAPKPGQHVRASGEDFSAGHGILPAGLTLAPQHLVLLRTAGVERVLVQAPVNMHLLQTGNELATAAPELGHAGVFESTQMCLATILENLGGQAPVCARVADRADLLQAALEQALEQGAELIVTTGGVSKGVADFVPDVVKALGGTIVLHRLAIKPAKPLLVATFPSGAILVGLPGNPVSQLLACQAAVLPLLRGQPMLRGMATVKAVLAEDCTGKEGFRTFIRGTLKLSAAGTLQVWPLPGNASHCVSNFATCNAWLHIVGAHAAESLVEVSPFLSTQWSLT